MDRERNPKEPAHREDEDERRERGMDQTLEDTYPASDPLSTIPDP